MDNKFAVFDNKTMIQGVGDVYQWKGRYYPI